MGTYTRRSPGDSFVPQHKQDTFRDKGGKVRNVDTKMRSTAVELNQRGIQTRYSDQGDLRLTDKTKDAYISFNDAGNKRLKGLPPRFRRTHSRKNTWNPEHTIIDFRGGPVIGAVNRARVRREAKTNVYKSAFGIDHGISKSSNPVKQS